ncbi:MULTISPECIES: fibronectin type III domain-containing protein [unclassified Enterococcus]|uniref:fibronectin type III domain-containing protein n=1 Tax=unclassified Enterococcus TaxID=2608891 RepID=UPI003F690D62
MNQISRHQIFGKILFVFVIILTIFPSKAYSTTKTTFNESGVEQNRKNRILNFENDSEESINWSNSNFPDIPSKLNRNEDIQMIENLNDSLRRKYMNRSELYENTTLLEEIDSLFTKSFNQETVLYANLSMEDFGINSEYLLDDSETVINSTLNDSLYGIDHGYLLGSLTPQPFNKERKENIQLKLTLPKDTEAVRLGSLSNSYYILKRDQALNYTKKEIIREGDLTPSIKINANIVPKSTIEEAIGEANEDVQNILMEYFDISTTLVQIEAVGLNAGFVLANSNYEDVILKSLTNLRKKNFLNEYETKNWQIFLTSGYWQHSSVFDNKTMNLTLEEKRIEFDNSFDLSDAGLTWTKSTPEGYIASTAISFNQLNHLQQIKENRLLDEYASTIIHEYFHFAIRTNYFFQSHPMLSGQIFDEVIEELRDLEIKTLIDILDSNYAEESWEEYICEAFRAKLHPYKPIAERSATQMVLTNRFLDNLFDTVSPTIPKNLQKLDVTGNTVKFTFDHSTDNVSVEKYNIYMDGELIEDYNTVPDDNVLHSPNPGENQKRIEVDVKNLNQVTEYEFRVTAMDEAKNESEKSEPLKIKTKDTEPPKLSGNLKSQVLSSSHANFNLATATDNVGVVKKKIKREETSSLFNISYLPGKEVIFEVEGNARHFNDVSIQKGKRYTYSMTALDEAGNESKPSNEVIVETSDEDDRKRNEDKARDTTSTNATLDWSGSFSEISPSSFQLFGWAQGITGWTFTGVTTIGSSLSSVVVGLTPGLSHLYLVLPIDENGNPMAEGLDISVDALPHSVIDLRITDVQHTQISLNWESLNNQASLPGTLYHDIYRNDEKIATIDGWTTSYTDSGLTHSTKYEYYVVARIGDTPSEKSKTVTGTTLKVYDDTMVRFESVLFPSEILTHSKQVNEPITVAEFHNKSTQFIHLIFDETRNAYQLFNKETGMVFGIDQRDNSTIMMQENKTQDDQFWVLNQIENNIFELENYQYNSKVLTVNNNRTTQLSDKNESTKTQQFDLLMDEEPPTVPQDFTYHDLTDTSVRLKWAPSTDNVGVSGYLVYNQSRLIGQVDSKTTEYVVNDLLSYTDYHFSVVAIDHSGNQSESSDILEVRTRPKVPMNLSASDMTQTSFTLHWENLEKEEVITEYEIYQDETLIRTVDRDTLSLSVENLDTAMYYNFTVKAKTAVNSSLASEKLTIKTQSLPLSEIVKGYSLTDNEIIITLDRASYEGHNRIVLLNQGDYVGETYNNRFFYARLVNSTEDTVDIRFETNTTTNDLTLEIRSGQPGGQQDDVLETLSILPLSPPKNLSYDEIDDSSVRLSWEPGDNHSSETGYEIYQNEKLIQTAQGSETTFTVENLQSATDYKFTVKARVGSQTSQPSNEVEITTLPKAPRNLQANNITDSSALLTWEAAEPIEIVAGYEIYQNNELIHQVDKFTEELQLEDLDSMTESILTVKTKTESGRSVPSNDLKLVTLPKAPLNLRIEDKSQDSVLLAWEAGETNQNILGYAIYQNNQLIETVDSDTLSYKIDQLDPSLTYDFSVKTKAKENLFSASSNTVEWQFVKENKNLVRNGDFSNGFDDWNLRIGSMEQGGRSEIRKESGRNYAHLMGRDIGDLEALSQTIDTSEVNDISIFFEDRSPFFGLKFNIDFYRGGQQVRSDVKLFYTSTNWQKREVYYNVDAIDNVVITFNNFTFDPVEISHVKMLGNKSNN